MLFRPAQKRGFRLVVRPAAAFEVFEPLLATPLVQDERPASGTEWLELRDDIAADIFETQKRIDFFMFHIFLHFTNQALHSAELVSRGE